MKRKYCSISMGVCFASQVHSTVNNNFQMKKKKNYHHKLLLLFFFSFRYQHFFTYRTIRNEKSYRKRKKKYDTSEISRKYQDIFRDDYYAVFNFQNQKY